MCIIPWPCGWRNGFSPEPTQPTQEALLLGYIVEAHQEALLLGGRVNFYFPGFPP